MKLRHSLNRMLSIGLFLAATLLLFILVIGCDVQSQTTKTEETTSDARILALGDSIIAWNAGESASIPDVIGQRLGRDVVNASVSGALFSADDPEAAKEGLDIRAQYREGNWGWLVLDGGGNDFGDECGCGECRNVLNELISSSGQSGEIPVFVKGIAESGLKVLYLGYAKPPSGSEFEACTATLDVFHSRLQSMANSFNNVFFLPNSNVIDSSNLALFDGDLVHPSILGSKIIGERVAEEILKIEAAQ